MAVEFDASQVGVWIEGAGILVDPSRTVLFSHAIGDADPRHLAGEAVAPMFGVVPCYDVLFRAAELVTPPAYRQWVVHAGHDARFARSLEVGESIAAKARVSGLRPSRSGTVISIEMVVVGADGSLVAEHHATAFVRGAVAAASVGETPEPAMPGERSEALAEYVSTFEREQAAMYADATGDRSAPHVDGEAARAVGFRDIIAHGLCVTGICSVGAIDRLCGGDAARLRRLSVRLSEPTYPADTLTTAFCRGGPSSDSAQAWFRFETENQSGGFAVRGGLVEVGDRGR